MLGPLLPTSVPPVRSSISPSALPTVEWTDAPTAEPSVRGQVDWSSPSATPFGSAVSAETDEGQLCVSAWAFAAVGAVESAIALSYGQPLQPLSVQYVVNCESFNGLSFGCNGGDPFTAFSWMVSSPSSTFLGIPTASNLNYTSDVTAIAGTCPSVSSISAVAHSKPVSVSRFTYEVGILKRLLTALNDGPVAVMVTASSMVFQLYVSGVITDLTCGNASTVDHVLLAVGYGQWQGGQYIKLKNSWGTNWGSNGYVLIGADEAMNYCGVLTDISYPIVK